MVTGIVSIRESSIGTGNAFHISVCLCDHSDHKIQLVVSSVNHSGIKGRCLVKKKRIIFRF